MQTNHTFHQSAPFSALPEGDERIDMVFTSPPVPMSVLSDKLFIRADGTINQVIDNSGAAAFEKMHQLLDTTWRECVRVVKPGGFITIHIPDVTRLLGDSFSLYPNHSRVIQSLTSLGCEMLPSIIWRRPISLFTKYVGSGLLPGSAYTPLEHEWILIFRKPGKRVYTSAEKKIRNQSAIFWEERNLWFSDTWQDLTDDSIAEIPKGRIQDAPIDIAQRLVLMHTIYGDTVLDPFARLGTTSLVGMMTGRNTISAEHNKKYAEIAVATPTKRGTKDKLNVLLDGRISNHLELVNTKDLLYFRYRNESLGIPVKTQQEKALSLLPIKSISRTDNVVKVNYRKYKSSEIEELIHLSRL